MNNSKCDSAVILPSKSDSVVCIPTLKRTEMLALTLEKLSQTPEADRLDVRIFLDHCPDIKLEETEFVRDEYFPQADIFRAQTHVIAPSGTWNILQSLKNGYESGAKFVFLVEEDVLVRPEFFQRHYEMQESGDYFVTCGRRCGHMPLDFYSNPGSCYKREKLGLVVPHIRMEYFANLSGYVEKYFPRMDDLGVLDDGLIRRIMKSAGGKALCAEPRICSHVGFHYYGRLQPWIVSGTIQERVEQLRKMLPTVDPMGRYSRDFEPF